VKTISKLKKDLDKVFSLYIRLRYASKDGIVKCFTCDKTAHYKKMHAGHFMSRKHHATRWNEDNVQVQCPKCNLFGQGEQYAFGKLLDIRIGDGKAEELQELSRTTVKYMRFEYEDMIKHYKEKVNAIKTD
jgi:5-methylcytosine-specific restriction endonuclease McrA|tara:strand:- start:253 stop:645 length:393 start_codon:yes stop_codon:yes gene_type:complete